MKLPPRHMSMDMYRSWRPFRIFWSKGLAAVFRILSMRGTFQFPIQALIFKTRMDGHCQRFSRDGKDSAAFRLAHEKTKVPMDMVVDRGAQAEGALPGMAQRVFAAAIADNRHLDRGREKALRFKPDVGQPNLPPQVVEAHRPDGEARHDVVHVRHPQAAGHRPVHELGEGLVANARRAESHEVHLRGPPRDEVAGSELRGAEAGEGAAEGVPDDRHGRPLVRLEEALHVVRDEGPQRARVVGAEEPAVHPAALGTRPWEVKVCLPPAEVCQPVAEATPVRPPEYDYRRV